MNIGVTYIVQGGSFVLQALNLAIGSGYLSPKGQAAAATAITTIQAVIGVLAHFSPPPRAK